MIWPALLLLLGSPEAPESQLVTVVDGQEVFPPAFRGVWSKSADTCRDQYALETFAMSEDRLDGYEWDAVLLKSTPVIYHSSPRGDDARTVVVLTADRGETEVGLGKRRITLMGGKLHMSNAEEVSEEEHLTAEFASVKCAP